MGILRDGIVKTRKDHICHGCKKKIPKGTVVYSQTNVVDEVYTIYMCDDCRSYCGSCKECYEIESAFEGFIAECRAESKRHEQPSGK